MQAYADNKYFAFSRQKAVNAPNISQVNKRRNILVGNLRTLDNRHFIRKDLTQSVDATLHKKH